VLKSNITVGIVQFTVVVLWMLVLEFIERLSLFVMVRFHWMSEK